MSNIKKNKNVKVTTKNGGSYSYNYTDLASINDYLDNNNIKYYQYIESSEYGDYIMTVIIENGEDKPARRGCKVISASTTSGGNVAQDYGAILTYCRRYSLLLALGLATDDNDANELTNGSYEVNDKGKREFTKEEAENYVITFGKYSGKTLKEIVDQDENYSQWLLEKGKDDVKTAISMLIKPIVLEETPITEGDIQIIEDGAEKGLVDIDEMLKYYKVKSLNELNFSQADAIKKIIDNRRKNK